MNDYKEIALVLACWLAGVLIGIALGVAKSL